MMYTIGRLAKQFNLSRSTLLHYDSIGLLKASGRSLNGYRVYSPRDAERLDQICTYRKAGLSLAAIGRILDSSDTSLVPVLEQRLEDLNTEIDRLRDQQRLVLELLNNPDLLERTDVVDMKTWMSILEQCGVSHQQMKQWHTEFERTAPEKHTAFLKFLNLSNREIETIRGWANTP